MNTAFSGSLTAASVKDKISRFYDFSSPFYLAFYGEHIHDGYYITGLETRSEAQTNLTKLIADKAGIQSGAKILDVGCGIGGSSIWLAKNLNAVTTGVTISPVQVEIARKLATANGVSSSFMLMDAEDLHFDNSFDVIWVVAALTHFTRQEKFIESAAKLLKPRGKFVIFDWMVDEGVADALNDRDIKPVAEGMLLSGLYSVNTCIEWFLKYGFRITYIEDITHPTLKTWDDALAAIKQPSAIKLIRKISPKSAPDAFRFLKSIKPMKSALLAGKLRSAIIIAESFNPADR